MGDAEALGLGEVAFDEGVVGDDGGEFAEAFTAGFAEAVDTGVADAVVFGPEQVVDAVEGADGPAGAGEIHSDAGADGQCSSSIQLGGHEAEGVEWDDHIGVDVEAGEAGGGLFAQVDGVGFGAYGCFNDLDGAGDGSGGGGGLVGAAVGDDDDFEFAGAGAVDQGAEGAGDDGFFVVGGDDDLDH